MSGLLLEDVEILRGSERLLKVSAHVGPGEILTLTGASGSGKSTLVKAIGGFLMPPFTCSGRIVLDGIDITLLPAERRRVGILFQDPLLFPHFNVEQNIRFALPRGGSMSARRTRVRELLEPVGLGELLERDPATLSGGQQARVALMRVIASEPQALLLDEPFSKLDPQLRDAVREFVFQIVRSRALPVLLVTHDRQDADAAGGPSIDL